MTLLGKTVSLGPREFVIEQGNAVPFLEVPLLRTDPVQQLAFFVSFTVGKFEAPDGRWGDTSDPIVQVGLGNASGYDTRNAVTLPANQLAYRYPDNPEPRGFGQAMTLVFRSSSWRSFWDGSTFPNAVLWARVWPAGATPGATNIRATISNVTVHVFDLDVFNVNHYRAESFDFRSAPVALNTGNGTSRGPDTPIATMAPLTFFDESVRWLSLFGVRHRMPLGTAGAPYIRCEVDRGAPGREIIHGRQSTDLRFLRGAYGMTRRGPGQSAGFGRHVYGLSSMRPVSGLRTGSDIQVIGQDPNLVVGNTAEIESVDLLFLDVSKFSFFAEFSEAPEDLGLFISDANVNPGGFIQSELGNTWRGRPVAHVTWSYYNDPSPRRWFRGFLENNRGELVGGGPHFLDGFNVNPAEPESHLQNLSADDPFGQGAVQLRTGGIGIASQAGGASYFGTNFDLHVWDWENDPSAYPDPVLVPPTAIYLSMIDGLPVKADLAELSVRPQESAPVSHDDLTHRFEADTGQPSAIPEFFDQARSYRLTWTGLQAFEAEALASELQGFFLYAPTEGGEPFAALVSGSIEITDVGGQRRNVAATVIEILYTL